MSSNPHFLFPVDPFRFEDRPDQAGLRPCYQRRHAFTGIEVGEKVLLLGQKLQGKVDNEAADSVQAALCLVLKTRENKCAKHELPGSASSSSNYLERVCFAERRLVEIALELAESEDIVGGDALEDVVVDGRVPVGRGAEHGVELVANAVGHVDLLWIIEVDAKVQSAGHTIKTPMVVKRIDDQRGRTTRRVVVSNVE